MKENRYDDEVFFKKYSGMSRSKEGLKAAGEWETLEKLLPDFTGKSILDLGCGYGWHCLYAAEHGAVNITGTDISEKMLSAAEEKLEEARASGRIPADTSISYMRTAMEDMDFKPESFDIVLSSLALHYVEDFYGVLEKIYSYLKKGGELIFSVEHPVFTAYGSQEWAYNEDGSIKYFPVDNYYYEGKRDAIFLGEHVVKYHRTLTTYMNGLIERGFEIEKVTEPKPSKKQTEEIPGMKDEMRRPMMIIIKARKGDTSRI